MGGWLDGWTGGWLDGWMIGWVDGWMVGWLEVTNSWLEIAVVSQVKFHFTFGELRFFTSSERRAKKCK